MARIKFITALNQELWQRYAELTVKTWQWEPQIYWQQDQRAIWRTWRERNRLRHPEHCFKQTWSRFSHKVEAQCRAILEHRDHWDYLVWLDADMVQLQPCAEPELEKLLPRPGDMVSYLGRGANYHPETGWLCYDLHHPQLEEFVEELALIYLSDRIFTLAEWHDAYVWDYLCRELKIPRTDLGPGSPGEAVQRSPLKDYYCHLKGDRKQNIHNTTFDVTELMRKPHRSK